MDEVQEGWLIKEGHVRKNWKRRWFTLVGPTVEYRTEPSDKFAKGVIELDMHTLVRNAETAKGREFCFSVETLVKEFFLVAETKHEMEKWVETLLHVVNRLVVESYGVESDEESDIEMIGETELDHYSAPPVPSVPVAVVGMACHYPGADTPRKLWENVLAKRREFRRMLDVRLPLSEYYSPDRNEEDKTYGKMAAFIDGFDFNWKERRINKNAYESYDVAHWLALEVALMALKDYGNDMTGGGGEQRYVDHTAAGVIVGNTLTGEITRAEGMRQRWPFVRKTIRHSAKEKGMSHEETEDLVKIVEKHYKSVFHPTTEDSLVGKLSNTIPGLIANYCDLRGGAYTVDGACSSSLLAVATACSYLSSRDMNFAIAGGVDISMDTFEMIGFAKAGALSDGEMKIYDENSDGFIPGEGCGMLCLKRLEDARKDGNYIYAVIDGYGISSDGRGGMTAPKVSSQVLAIRRAYAKVHFPMSEISWVEGHGTGTTVGDAVELEALATALEKEGCTIPRTCGVTSVKAIVGHTKAASGVCGLLKTIIALNRRVFPPLGGLIKRHPIFEKGAEFLYPLSDGMVREPGELLHAGVSGMGFGGINCHIVLSSPEGVKQSERLRPAVPERNLLYSSQQTELFILNADSVAVCKRRVAELISVVKEISMGEMTDLSCSLLQTKYVGAPGVRVAIVAWSPEDLCDKLENVLVVLKNEPPEVGHLKHLDSKCEVVISHVLPRATLGFLFPGQGAQMMNMARRIIRRYDWAKEMVEEADSILYLVLLENISSYILKSKDPLPANVFEELEGRLSRTAIAQPAIVLASILWYEFLKRAGIRPSAVGGHSLGELTALYAGGYVDFATVLQIAARRGDSMRGSIGKDPGAMSSIRADVDTVNSLIIQVDVGYVTIANINSPNHVVVSGETEAILQLEEIAAVRNIHTRRLKVERAFHSKLMDSAVALFKECTDIPTSVSSPRDAPTVYSSMTGDPLPRDDFPLHDHLISQIETQVNFVGMLRNMRKNCDLCIEVGPGKALSGLWSATFDENRELRVEILRNCYPIESAMDRDSDLNVALANLFVFGYAPDGNFLFHNRLVRPFVPPSSRIFIQNPCERPFAESSVDQVDHSDVSVDVSDKTRPEREEGKSSGDMFSKSDIFEVLKYVVEDFTGFPSTSIRLSDNLLTDLNLDSLKSAQVLARTSNRLGLTGMIDASKLANSSLSDISSEFLAKIASLEGDGTAKAAIDRPFDMDRYSSWSRKFEKQFVMSPLRVAKDDSIDSDVSLFHEEGDTSAAKISSAISDVIHLSSIATWGNQITKKMSSRNGASIILWPISTGTDSYVSIERISRRAVAAASVMLSSSRLLFIQFSPLEEGLEYVSAEDTCCSPLCATAVLESGGNLKASVLTLPRSLSNAEVAQIIQKELLVNQEDDFREVLYKSVKGRFVAEYSPLVDTRIEEISFAEEDVILATGGAKGLTRTCVEALVKQHPCSVALIGRSSPKDQDSIIAVSRFTELSARANYYQCDVSDYKALKSVVNHVRREMGAITMVVHGAGLNKVSPLSRVTIPAVMEEIGPKVTGMQNLCRLMESSPPKLFVCISSVAEVIGLANNAMYSLSNSLAKQLCDIYAKTHQSTYGVTCAYTLWDDVGMGARSGVVELLKSQGIQGITAEDGARHFVDITSRRRESVDTEVVIASRLNGVPTWKTAKLPRRVFVEGKRFLEYVVLFERGVEIVSRFVLDASKDLYLKDHIYEGTILFPAVFGLEAFAQLTEVVTGKVLSYHQVTISDATFSRPVVLPSTGTALVECRVMVTSSSDEEVSVDCEIRSQDNHTSESNFSAKMKVVNVQEDSERETFGKGVPPLSIDPPVDFYGEGRILFHGPRFQRISEVLNLEYDAKHERGTALYKVRWSPFSCDGTDSFSGLEGNVESGLVLGDPYCRDTLMQGGHLLATHKRSLPASVGKIDIVASFRPQMDCLVTVKITLKGFAKRKLVFDIVVIDEEGRVLEVWTDYKSHFLGLDTAYPTHKDFIHPSQRDRKVIMKELHNYAYALDVKAPENLGLMSGLSNFTQVSVSARRLVQQKLIGDTVGKKDASITWEESGRPRMTNYGYSIALAFTDRLLLAVSSSCVVQGCALCPVVDKDRESWINELGYDREQLLDTLSEFETVGLSGAYIWCALEAARMGRKSDPSVVSVRGVISLRQKYKRAFLFEIVTESSTVTVLSIYVILTCGPNCVAAFCVEDIKTESNFFVEDSWWSGGMPYKNELFAGPDGQNVFKMRIPITFRDLSPISHAVHYSSFLEWQGKVREAALVLDSETKQSTYKAYSEGKVAAVTGMTKFRSFGLVHSEDVVEANFYMRKFTDFDAKFEMMWDAVDSEGNSRKVAQTIYTFISTEVHGKGAVKSSYWPEFMYRFLTRMRPSEKMSEESVEPEKGVDFEKGMVGNLVSTSPSSGTVLTSYTFTASPHDGNLLGNVYYSVFSSWQEQVMDNLFFDLAPDLYVSGGRHGFIWCLKSQFHFLHEVMPFDRVLVQMHLRKLYRCGAKFYFEFLVEWKDGRPSTKVAHATQTVVCIEGVPPAAKEWPNHVKQALLSEQ